MPVIDLRLVDLPGLFKQNRISDDEALALYNAWRDTPPGEDIVADGSSMRTLVSKGFLKPRGRQEGTASKFALTQEGRMILVEMVTNLPNALTPDAEMPTYSKIKSRAKRARQTFLKKASYDGIRIVVRTEGFDATTS